MVQTHLLLAFFWILYCVLHSVLAASSIKRWAQQKMKARFRYYRIGYTIFSFLGLIAILIFQFSIHSAFLYTGTLVTSLTGVIMMATGSALMVIMIWKYFMQLSGVRWLTQEQVKSKLQVSGLHRFVRHPLYLGTFVFIWGWFIFYPTASFFICSSIITTYTLIALKYEEQKLIEEFGNDYIRYKKEVPAIIPRLGH